MDTDPLPALITAALTMPFSAAQIFALSIALLCLCLSGFVSGSEMAFFSLSATHCDELDQSRHGSAVRHLLAQPQRLLACILIANNLVNVTIVVLCNFALGPIFDGMSPVLSFILQTILLTFLILLFGEILPKLISNSNPVRWAKFAAGGMSAICKIVGPLASLLVRSGSFVNRVVAKQAHDISVDELSRALELTHDAPEDDKEMLEGILRFGNTTASEIMTPRVDITWLDESLSFDSVMDVVLESGYSRMPVYRESQDQVTGVLYARDLLPYIGHERPADFHWPDLLRQPYFVPESRMIDDLLEDFRRLKLHLAVVVDEYGGTQGIVTLEDVLEEIMGDIDDEYDAPEQTYRKLRDDTYLFEGRTPLTDFFRITGLEADDYADVTEDVETLAGMLLAIKGDFPSNKEALVYGRCHFLVLGIEDHRITEVRLKVMPAEQNGDDAE